MMPGHRRCRLLSTVVAAEAIVGGDLVEAQHAAHGEVIFKMRVAKLALQPAKLGEHTVQARIIDTAAGESLVKLTFFARTSLPSGTAVSRISSKSARVRSR